MPELPEVEVTARSLVPFIEGQRITAMHCFDHRLRLPVAVDLEETLTGLRVSHVERRAKYLLWRCRKTSRGNTGSGTLLLHLGMSGSLRVVPLSPGEEPQPRRKHDHLEFAFDNGTLVRYHDPRRFGLCVWAPTLGDDIDLLAHLGPEPLGPAFTAAALRDAAQHRAAPIKNVLMDAHVVVGVGNIYASEALFRAGIRPTIPANRLSLPRLTRLVDAVRATLEDAITAGGSSLRDYRQTDGSPGEFQNDTFVYGHDGEPCKVCGHPIRQLRQAGRSTFYCPHCQR